MTDVEPYTRENWQRDAVELGGRTERERRFIATVEAAWAHDDELKRLCLEFISEMPDPARGIQRAADRVLDMRAKIEAEGQQGLDTIMALANERNNALVLNERLRAVVEAARAVCWAERQVHGLPPTATLEERKRVERAHFKALDALDDALAPLDAPNAQEAKP